MKRRVLILSGTQLSVNPRVVKEADVLSDAGYSVEVAGGVFDAGFMSRERALSEARPWKYTMLVDASSQSRRDKVKWLWLRARRRLWREAYARANVANARQLGYLAPEMLAYATDYDADLTIVHNPAATWVGAELIRRGRRVAVDMEDWYSEDLTPEEMIHFPATLMRTAEGEALRGAAFSVTTSHCMSEALSAAYGCRAPAVVYNSFPNAYRESIDGDYCDRVDKSLPSICWFSQVVGPGRGLESLMRALHELQIPCEIHLRGHTSADFREHLLGLAPPHWRKRIHFHPQVPHSQLISRLAEHDIGLVAEIPHSRNKDLTIANKLPLYLLAGVPVAASDTAGQREAAALADGAVFLFKAGSGSDLASLLTRMLSAPELRAHASQMAVAAATGVFSWSKSADVLSANVDKALSAQPAR